MDTETYHHKLQAQQATWSSLHSHKRVRLAAKARARSAARWAEDDNREDQQRRAGRLQLVDGLAGAASGDPTPDIA